jgi:hypothetical protein
MSRNQLADFVRRYGTHAPQQTASLFDHFVGDSEHTRSNCKAERLGGLEIEADNGKKLPQSPCVLRKRERSELQTRYRW